MCKPQLLLSISMETICRPCRHFSVRLTPRTSWGWQVDSNLDQRWGCRVYKPSRCFFPDRYEFPIPTAQSSRNVFFSAQAMVKTLTTLTVLCIFPSIVTSQNYFPVTTSSDMRAAHSWLFHQTIKCSPPGAIPGIDIEYLRSDRILAATENIHQSKVRRNEFRAPEAPLKFSQRVITRTLTIDPMRNPVTPAKHPNGRIVFKKRWGRRKGERVRFQEHGLRPSV